MEGWWGRWKAGVGLEIEAVREGMVNTVRGSKYISSTLLAFSCRLGTFLSYFSDFMCLGPCSYSHEVVECNSVHHTQQTLSEPTVPRVPFKGSEMASAPKLLMT